MKKITALFVLMVLTTTLFSQTWESNIEQAKSRADKEGKNIILTFSGSDWCIPCMKLEKNIWESQEFVEYSKDHFVLVQGLYRQQ